MYDVIIIGGGMAGYSAALYAGRRGMKVLVLAKDIGGQANSTDLIENYPAVTASRGHDLVQKVRKQAQGWGMDEEIEEATKLKPANGGFVVQTTGKQYKSQTVILAFGKSPMDLRVPGEAELKGRGVSYCATCDAPLYKGKIVVVAGYGDFGLEAAILAAKFAKKVYTLSKTDKLVGHPGLAKKVLNNRKIELVPRVQVNEIVGEGKISHLKLQKLDTGEQLKLQCDAMLVEIGYSVNSAWLKGVVDLNGEGEVVTGPDQSTSLPGVYAAGDLTDRPYKQAVISAGEGASAALAAFDYIMKSKGSTGLSSDWTEIRKVR